MKKYLCQGTNKFVPLRVYIFQIAKPAKLATIHIAHSAIALWARRISPASLAYKNALGVIVIRADHRLGQESCCALSSWNRHKFTRRR